MKTSCKIMIFLLFFLFGQHIQGQTSGNKAKELYLQAENAFQIRDYSKSLNLLNQVQSTLGSSNAMIESLRTKNYFEQGEYQKAKSSLDVFFTFSNTADNLLTEMNGYLENTNAKLKEEQERKIAEQQKAIREEQSRIEKESQEKKDYQLALDANSVYQYNRFISTYPNSQYISDIREKLDYAYVLQGNKYIAEEKYNEAVELFGEYNNKFPNGMNGARINTNLAETYYLMGEKARKQKKDNLAKEYYNKAVGVRVYSIYSRYYKEAQARLKEYKDAELQVKKEMLMVKANKNLEIYKGYRKKVIWYSGSAVASFVTGIVFTNKSEDNSAYLALSGGLLVTSAFCTIKALKSSRKGRQYYQDYQNLKNQADGIQLSVAPLLTPNQGFGLALRLDF